MLALLFDLIILIFQKFYDNTDSMSELASHSL